MKKQSNLSRLMDYAGAMRGVPVVKTFGQTIFSFKRFKCAIDNCEKWVIAYTKALRLPMMFYTTAINGVFAFLIAGGIIFTRGGVTNELLLNLIFYIVITPIIGTTLTKIMFMSEDSMIVNDAINRIVALEEGVQECIESLQDLKANNAEENYLKGLGKKIDDVEKRHIIAELGVVVFVVSSTLILKFGIAAVALVGSALLIQGEIDIPLFFMFLLVASRLYAPLEGALQNLAAVFLPKRT